MFTVVCTVASKTTNMHTPGPPQAPFNHQLTLISRGLYIAGDFSFLMSATIMYYSMAMTDQGMMLNGCYVHLNSSQGLVKDLTHKHDYALRLRLAHPIKKDGLNHILHLHTLLRYKKFA